MDKQKIILAGIFVVTIVIGLSAILISNLITAPKTPSGVTTTTSVQLPSLSPSLYCTSTASNTSLTLVWNIPSGIDSSYTVSGQITDFSTQSSPSSFGPIPIKTGQYVFTGANGLDKYYASIYVQDSKGNKGATTTSNQIDSSQCTTGSQPTPTVALADTTSPTSTATPTKAPISTAVTATTSTTPTVTSSLTCGTFSLSQNGASLASNTVTPGTSEVTIVPGITSPSGAALSYASATWNISPSNPALNVTTSGSQATWTPPTSTSNGSSYTITLSGVTDANGNTLSSPCSVTIALASGSLPNTAGSTPTIAMLLMGLITTLVGSILLLRRQNTQY